MSGIDAIWTMNHKIQTELAIPFDERRAYLLQNISLNRIYAIYFWALMKKYDNYHTYTPDFARIMRNCYILHPQRICDIFEAIIKDPLHMEEIFKAYFLIPYDFKIDTNKNIYLVQASKNPVLNKEEFFNPIDLQNLYLKNPGKQNVFIIPISNQLSYLVHIGANNTSNSVMHDLMMHTTYLFNSTRDNDINTTINLIDRLANKDTSFEDGKTKFIYVRPDSYDNLYVKFSEGKLKQFGVKLFHVHEQDLLI